MMPRSAVATVVTLLIATMLSGVAFAATGPNVIRRIDVQEQDHETVILIEGSTTPTFTVFKLDDPVRLFVDIANADIQAVDHTLDIENGVLGQVGVLQFSNGGAPVGRVIVAFDKAAAYDVRTKGTTVEIVVDATDRSPRDTDLTAVRDEYAKLKRSLDDQRQALAALKAAREKEEALSTKAREARLQEERLKSSIEEGRRHAEELKAQAERTRTTLLEEADLIRKAKEKAAERKVALEQASQREEEKLAALATEKLRIEEAAHAVKEVTKLEAERKAALSEAARLEKERTAAIQRARTVEDEKAEELRAARDREEALLQQLTQAREREQRLAVGATKEHEEIEALRAGTARARTEAEKARIEAEAERRETQILQDKLVAEAERMRLERASVEATRRRGEQEKVQAEAMRGELAELREKAKAHEAAAARALRKALEHEAAARKAAELQRASEEAKALAAQKGAQEKAVRQLASQLAEQETRLEALAKKELSERQRIAELEKTRTGREAELKKKMAAQETELRDLERRRAAQHSASGDLEGQLARQRTEVEALQQQAATVRSDLKRLEAERIREEQRVGRLREQLADLRSRKAKVIGAEAQRLQQQLQAKEDELVGIRDGYEKALQEARTALADRRAAAAGDAAAKEVALREKERQLSALATQLGGREEEIQRLRRSLASDEERAAEMARLQAQLQESEHKLTELGAVREQAESATRALAKKERELTDLSGQLTARESELARLQEQVEAGSADEAAVARLQSALDAKEREIATLRAEQARAEMATRELQAKEQEIQTLRAQVASGGATDAQVAELKKRLVEYETKVDSMRALYEAARQEARRARAGETTAAVQEKERQLTELATRLDAKEGEIKQLREELRTAGVEDDEVRRLRAELQTRERKLEDLAARYEAPGAAAEDPTTRLQRFLEEQSAMITRLQGRDGAPATPAAATPTAAPAAVAKAAPRKAPAAPSKVAAATSRVRDVAFREKDDVTSVVVALQGEPRYEVVEASPTRLVLLLHDAQIPRALERRLDTSEFGGPVRMVSSYSDPARPGSVRVEVELDDAVSQDLRVEGGELVWSFVPRALDRDTRLADAASAPRIEGRGDEVMPRATPAGYGYHPERVGAAPPQAAGGPGSIGGASVAPGGPAGPGPSFLKSTKRRAKRKYTGRRINLTIKDADIQDVLTFLAREGKVNIVASEDVRGKVSFHLEDIPWDLALDMILKAKGLDYVKEHGVYRVAPIESIQQEFELELEKRKKISELKQLIVKLITVNYADAGDLAERVKDILSEKGTVGVDDRTNTLIVKDIEDHVLAIEDLVRRLDTQTPQVLIEARIVEATSNYTQEIGIQWGGGYAMSPAFGNQTGLAFPSVVGIAGGADDEQAPTGGLFSGDRPNFAVNLPAAVGAGAGGALGITLGSIGGAGNLSLRLSAAEEEGTVKIISSPKISTLDNKEAIIQQGVSIPISVVSSQGVQTQFFSAELQLKVVPHVTPDGNIALKIDITKNEPDFGRTSANGNPTIQKKEAHTELLLKDGDTTVIGGIYTRNTSESFKEVPLFAKIPILGWLFKSRTEVDNRSELLIFITPRIVNREAAVVGG